MKKIVTPSEKGKKKRNEKIFALYEKIREQHSKSRCYQMIAEEIGISQSTVQRTIENDRGIKN